MCNLHFNFNYAIVCVVHRTITLQRISNALLAHMAHNSCGQHASAACCDATHRACGTSLQGGARCAKAAVAVVRLGSLLLLIATILCLACLLRPIRQAIEDTDTLEVVVCHRSGLGQRGCGRAAERPGKIDHAASLGLDVRSGRLVARWDEA